MGEEREVSLMGEIAAIVVALLGNQDVQKLIGKGVEALSNEWDRSVNQQDPRGALSVKERQQLEYWESGGRSGVNHMGGERPAKRRTTKKK
jgi:hypothetical protein